MFLVQTLCHLAPSEKGALGVSISHFLENGTGVFPNLIRGYLGLDRFAYLRRNWLARLSIFIVIP